MTVRRANTLNELLNDPETYGTIEVRPGVTVSYDHDHGDFFTVAIDGERRVTDVTEQVETWVSTQT